MVEKKNIFIKTEYIKLGQLIKYVNLINSGGDAKTFLLDNKVYVNGTLENRRGKKIYINDNIKFNEIEYLILEDKNGNNY